MALSTIVLCIVSPVNVLLNIALIHYTPLRLWGSAVALSITYWLSFGLLALFTIYSPVHNRNKTWGGIHLRAVFEFQSCVRFLKLALPGILMVGTEWCVWIQYCQRIFWGLCDLFKFRAAFEIVALAAGRLGHVSLAAQSVIMTTDQSKSHLHQNVYIAYGCSMNPLYLVLNTIPFGIGNRSSTNHRFPCLIVFSRSSGFHTCWEPDRIQRCPRRQTCRTHVGLHERYRWLYRDGGADMCQRCILFNSVVMGATLIYSFPGLWLYL